MSQLLRILASFRSGQLDHSRLLAQVQSLAAASDAHVDELIATLTAEHAKTPLPAATFDSLMARLQQASDRTLLRTPEATLAFLLGDQSPERSAAEVTRVLRSRNTASPSAPVRGPSSGEPFSRVLLNRFGLVALVGEGGMSRVYKAVDLRKVEAGADDPHVAIKVLNLPFDDVTDAMAVLHRELSSLQGLVHPNIVRVIDCDREGDTVFMSMEFLDGRTLSDRLRQPGFVGADRAVALPIIQGIAQALAFAHAKGIVHGDLKPGNVMITTTGELKVIDFGIARAVADPIKAFMRRGVSAADQVTGVTPAYASPQMLERRDADPRDDVYSLACIAWELMTGRHPFDRKVATLARDEGFELARSPELTEREYAALAHALAFSREVRTSSAQQFIEELSAAAARQRKSVWLGAALALAAGVTIFALRPRPPVENTAQQETLEPVAAKPAEPALSVGTVFRDCPTCPLMIVLPPGDFVQGTQANARGGEPFETPEHDVFIDAPFAAGQYELTVGEFAEFVVATDRRMSGCWKYDGTWTFDPALSWRIASEGQTAVHPVSCVSWEDATAYAEWLSQRTGQRYRLASAAEWEFAARGGSNAVRPWSADAAACANANVADRTGAQRYPGWTIHDCMDTYVQAAPVGSFAANAFALHDMLGNVFEWVQDCWHEDYAGAPTDGSARLDGDCAQHELRGGSWFTVPSFVRVSYRNRFATDYRSTSVGVRVVREVT